MEGGERKSPKTTGKRIKFEAKMLQFGESRSWKKWWTLLPDKKRTPFSRGSAWPLLSLAGKKKVPPPKGERGRDHFCTGGGAFFYDHARQAASLLLLQGRWGKPNDACRSFPGKKREKRKGGKSEGVISSEPLVPTLLRRSRKEQ